MSLFSVKQFSVVAAAALLSVSLGPEREPTAPPEFILADIYDGALASDGTNYLAVYNNRWDDGASIAVTPITAEGQVLAPRGRVIHRGGLFGGGFSPAVAYGAGIFLAAMTTTTGLDLVRLDATGTPLDTTPIPLSASDPDAPAIAFDGVNFLVTDRPRNPIWAYPSQSWRVSPSGQVLDATPIPFGGVRAIFDGTNYLVVSFNSIEAQLLGQHVRPDGSLVESSPIVLAESVEFNRLSAPSVACDVTGGCLLTWLERLQEDRFSLQGRRIAPDGTSGDPLSGFPISKSPITWANFTARQYQQLNTAVWWDGAAYNVAWPNGWQILGARLNGPKTEDLVDRVLQSIDPVPENEPGKVSVAQGTGGTLMSWQIGDGNQRGAHVRALRLDSGPVLRNVSFPIAFNRFSQGTPQIASNGSGYLLTWGQAGLKFARRTDAQGNPVDEQPLPILRDFRAMAVASVGADYLVVGEDHSDDGFSDIFGIRIPAQGPPGEPFAISARRTGDSRGREERPVVAASDHGYLVAWVDGRNSDETHPAQHFMTRVSPDGIVQDPGGILLVDEGWPFLDLASDGTNFMAMTLLTEVESDPQRPVTIAIDGKTGTVGATTILSTEWGYADVRLQYSNGQYLALWPGAGGQLNAMRVDPSGMPIDPSPFIIRGQLGNLRFPGVVPTRSGFFVVWSDRRNGERHAGIYGAHVSSAGVSSPPNGELLLADATYDFDPSPRLASVSPEQAMLTYARFDGDENTAHRAHLAHYRLLTLHDAETTPAIANQGFRELVARVGRWIASLIPIG
ncbi:hypothetical protein LVJ94_49060 [Pendulispora rubella]|uniref:Uncharacterized protein n=1 Tax=Pendulispora rubella TaxID=2741070 RepID=A0ABZ2L258_9BACT